MSTPIALRSRRVITPAGERAATILINDGFIEALLPYDATANAQLTDCGDAVVLPGLVDSHVHINEPGRTDWEGFDTATHAAAAGGITTLVDMPLNCIPVTTSAAALREKLAAVEGKLWVDCGYWGGATADNLHELPALLDAGVLGVKSFTIHSGIDEFQSVNEAQLLASMRELARRGLPHLVHAELDSAHTPVPAIGRSYAQFLQSRPRHWENDAVAMVIRVMQKLRAEGLEPRAHIVHLSSSEALVPIRLARAQGLQLTAETCPHYLTLWAEAIPDGATLFKCCPPIREEANREQLWSGLANGTIDCVVSDHSPCTPQLKAIDSGDLGHAWGGISALQFGLPLVWTEARARGFDLTDLARLMSRRPAQIAGLDSFKGSIAPGYQADFCVFDDVAEYTIETALIKHRHKISPYVGKRVTGRVLQTWLRGAPIYFDDNFFPEKHSHAKHRNEQYPGSARGRSLLRGGLPLNTAAGATAQ